MRTTRRLFAVGYRKPALVAAAVVEAEQAVGIHEVEPVAAIM